jgi:hypothetical protein
MHRVCAGSSPADGPPATGVSFQNTYGDTPDGSVMAFRVGSKAGKPALTPAWSSVNMKAPTPSIYTNGMIFVVADGDDPAQMTPSGSEYSIAERIGRASHSTLYALYAATGKVLFFER